jgi:hypothetical protein
MPGRRRLVALMLVAASGLAAGADSDSAVKATTATGDKVLLHPNGRWEYVDPKKAGEAKSIAQQYPENQGCPPGSQGQFFGVGRCIAPGDKDYNRGSLNPNRR